ncbi:MAG: hypothetical protein IT308_08765 [Anaerolineaceae bacterium]|nr:hypothetical protein [Anaerolineaceae bacterium]
MSKHSVLFITQRGERHQKAALDAAPPEFEITLRRNPSKEEIIRLLPGKEFLISERIGAVDAELIAAGKDLKLIQRLGSRTYDIDLPAAKQAGIPVCYWPIRSCVWVAENTLLQMLGLARRVREMVMISNEAADWGMPPKQCDEDYFAPNWSNRQDIRNIFQSTVGIVGFGEVGTEIAKHLKTFECTVLYYDKERTPASAEAEVGARYAELDDLLARSDFVCMAMPLFPETQGMVNAAFIQKMKPGAILVSSGAGGVFNEHDVAQAYLSGRLHGFACDTHDYEPIRPDSPLLEPSRQEGANVILTPHIAGGGVSHKSTERLADYTNLVNILQGSPLQFRLV